MKPTNKFFVFVYYVAGFVIKLLHPTTVEGLENLPRDRKSTRLNSSHL